MPVQFVFWISNSTKLVIATRKNISFSSCYYFRGAHDLHDYPQKGEGMGSWKIRIGCFTNERTNKRKSE